MTLRTVAYDPSRRGEVLDLLDRVYGESPEPAEVDWWFDGNPVGPRTLLLVEDAARVAAMLGASFYRVNDSGREFTVAVPLWAATDQSLRGKGIFQRLNHEIESSARAAGATLELGFTNRMAGPIYVSKLGWHDVDRLRVWVRPVSPGRRATPDATSFGEAQEEAYRAVAPHLTRHFVRDRGYLNWRYASGPREYAIATTRNGYAVVGRKRVRNVSAAYVADLVAPSFSETISLLRRCVRLARPARVLLAFVPQFQRAAYGAFGFVPTPMTVRLIGKALDGELPQGGGAWHFSLGDTDFF